MKKHKKLIVLVGLLLIVIIGAIVWRQLGGVDTAAATNYGDANKASQKVRETYLATEKAFNTYERETASSENKVAYEKAQQEYMSKMGALKAAIDKLDDKEVTDAYDKFKAKSDDYTDYTSGYVANVKAAQDLSTANCTKLMLSSSDVLGAYDASVKDCQVAIVTLKQSTNAGIAQFATEFEQSLQDRRAALVEAQEKAAANDIAGVQAAMNKALSEQMPDLQAQLAAAQQKLGVMSAYEEFHKIIADKYSETVKK